MNKREAGNAILNREKLLHLFFIEDATESWIGLDKLHSLTSSGNYGLKVTTLHSLIYQLFPPGSHDRLGRDGLHCSLRPLFGKKQTMAKCVMMILNSQGSLFPNIVQKSSPPTHPILETVS